eukprot:GHVU01036981.1.p3 GENE.GHVU01036981.1~~GHVU01036981.1.p3  ORF type:complete len:110 (-),score=1.98 GHVU01036981.1:192-521(-)
MNDCACAKFEYRRRVRRDAFIRFSPCAHACACRCVCICFISSILARLPPCRLARTYTTGAHHDDYSQEIYHDKTFERRDLAALVASKVGNAVTHSRTHSVCQPISSWCV